MVNNQLSKWQIEIIGIVRWEEFSMAPKVLASLDV